MTPLIAAYCIACATTGLVSARAITSAVKHRDDIWASVLATVALTLFFVCLKGLGAA